MPKSRARIEVEKILGEDVMKKVNVVFVDATNPTRRSQSGYRMKFTLHRNYEKEVTPEMISSIRRLPHVTRVEFNYDRSLSYVPGRFYDGLCVYFDKKPSTITVI